MGFYMLGSSISLYYTGRRICRRRLLFGRRAFSGLVFVFSEWDLSQEFENSLKVFLLPL